MRTDNKIDPRRAARLRGALLFAAILLFVVGVTPNLAQDYSQIGATEQVTESANAPDQDPAVEEDPLDDPVSDVGVTYDQDVISDWQQTRATVMGENLARLIREMPDYPEDFARAMARSTSLDLGWTGPKVAFTLIGVLLLGLVLEQLVTRPMLRRLYAQVDGRKLKFLQRMRSILMRVVIQLIGVAVLALVTYGAVIWLRHDNPYFELLFTECVFALAMLRLWMVMLRNVFSPRRPELRPIPLADGPSRQLHRWFIVFFFIIEYSGAFFTYLTRAGMSEAQLAGLLIPYTLSLNLIILIQVWTMRHKITGMFMADGDDAQARTLTGFLPTTWPFIFTAWLFLLWMLWLYKAFTGQWEEANYVSISWWITLAFLVADRIFYGVVRNVTDIPWLQSPTYEIRARRFIQVVQNGFRLLMIAVAVYMLSLAWGMGADTLMQSGFTQKALGQLINLLVIATITYVIWEFFNALIERKLPAETDALASLEGDGGGAGATRAETLLPLMRTLLSVVMFTFVLLSVLHSLGIAITPLLAGAGVVGIAIGFGAQKLVQDVLSGIFFLVDDAFRKNEYVEIEELRGTVEKISLRSMQLRHHLGAVQTIPYGEIKTVRNLSRDWVTMKLELRLPYDTDIEQVRKIIKREGQAMLEDPELGSCFILPLKSQGVMRVEESALIVRMKFTCRPGEQWVIRREAYRRVRDALAADGIFFAHREVRVRLPEDQVTKGLTENPEMLREALRQGGAAAEGAEAAAEAARRHGKMDDDAM